MAKVSKKMSTEVWRTSNELRKNGHDMGRILKRLDEELENLPMDKLVTTGSGLFAITIGNIRFLIRKRSNPGDLEIVGVGIHPDYL